MTTLTHYELIDYDEEREIEFDAAPCPFCKSERVEFVTDYHHVHHLAVMCVTCEARGPAKREYAQAVDGWNKADRCLR